MFGDRLGHLGGVGHYPDQHVHGHRPLHTAAIAFHTNVQLPITRLEHVLFVEFILTINYLTIALIAHTGPHCTVAPSSTLTCPAPIPHQSLHVLHEAGDAQTGQ